MLIVNTVKQRILEGQPAFGAGVGLGAPTAAALLAQAGFDFILVDYQHGEWDDAAALAAFRAISLQGAIPMLRWSPEAAARCCAFWVGDRDHA
jgi:4-hydroxy-2-oxoheptanedioate aldolase